MKAPSTATELWRIGAADVAAAICAGQVSSREVVKVYVTGLKGSSTAGRERSRTSLPAPHELSASVSQQQVLRSRSTCRDRRHP